MVWLYLLQNFTKKLRNTFVIFKNVGALYQVVFCNYENCPAFKSEKCMCSLNSNAISTFNCCKKFFCQNKSFLFFKGELHRSLKYICHSAGEWVQFDISSFEIIKSFYIAGVFTFKLVTTIFPQLTSTHIRNRKYHCLKILLLQYRYLINLRKEMKLAITYIIEF